MKKILHIVSDVWSLTSFKVVLTLLGLLAFYWYCFYDDSIDSLYKNIFAGVSSGLIITFFQVFVDFETLRLNRVIKNSKLKNMLSNRNDKSYYDDLLNNATSQVSIMGVTAERFFRDFGSAEESDKKLLDELLSKGVVFRLLLTEKDGRKANRAKDYREKYNKKDNFNIYYFDKSSYVPQSIFIVDDQCILGPIFSHQESKDTSALHFFDKNSDFSRQYIDYFEKIWAEKSNLSA